MNKSQIATEYLLIVGLGLLILIPSIAIFYNYSISQSEDAMNTKIHSIGRNIINNVENVYYMQAPSRRTLVEEFPNNIHNISIKSNNGIYLLEITHGSKKTRSQFITQFPIHGPLYNNQTGIKCEELSNTCFTSGTRRVILQATPTNVTIIIV